MRTILVTGANKGIGFAIAKGIVAEHDDTLLLLGSRDRERGEAAVQALVEAVPGADGRAALVEIDVASDDSVAAAAKAVQTRSDVDSLHGLVNNAGVGAGSLSQVLNVNTRGVHRVCEAFIPLLDPQHGRVVNVTSAAGPNFVAECSEGMKRFFLDGGTEWEDLDRLMREAVAMEGNAEAFQKRGLGNGAAYGLSKACANTYTLQLARRFPGLTINACTPGFIETDMTRPLAESQGKSPADFGMKPPEDGARSALHLLFGEVRGSGRYYGSDCKRSPLDRYRAPGAPEYSGD
ncbi:MAG: SDR family NAD(P)-dependent oxidoreductase [Myxococcales bacterium]|jgi:NAD(P)-dependent dehydrogenase (short-subunit alcohol dehydrogenase family)